MALGSVQHPANSLLPEPVRDMAHLLEAWGLFVAQDSALHLVGIRSVVMKEEVCGSDF